MLAELIILLCFSFVPFIWFQGGYQLFGHDIGYHINILSHSTTLLYSWNSLINFGFDWGIQAPKSLLILNLPELIPHIFVQNQRIIELISSCFWLVLPGIAMWIFVKSIFPEPRYWFLRLYTSLFSIFNFFLLQGWLIFEKTKFSLFAAFPLMILLLFRVFIQKKNIVLNSILLGMLFFFLNGGGLIPLYGGIIVAFSVFIVFSLAVAIQRRENLRWIFGSFLLMACVFLGLNAYWIVPTFGEFTKSYAGIVSGVGGNQNFLAWEREISKNASIVNLYRLEGIPDWYDNPAHPYANQFIVKKTLIAASFIPILFILLGMMVFGLRKETDKDRRLLILYSWILLVTGVLFAGGSHRPFGAVYEYAILHVPGFVIFRSSFYKFAQLVWFPVILLSGYYLSLFLSKYVTGRGMRIILSVAILLGVLWYHYPFFSKTAFNFRTGYSTRLNIPSYVLHMGNNIDNLVTSNGRVLIYPPLDLGYIGEPLDTYQWGYYSLDALPRMISERSIITNDLYGPLSIIENLQQTLHDGDSKTFQSLATTAGITHVLWRGDVKRSEAMNKDIPLIEMESRLSTMSALSKEVSVGPWTLFAVKGKVAPMIYLLNRQEMLTVTFIQQNPTHYSIEVNNDGSMPMTLVLNQKFDSGWKATAFAKNGKPVVLTKHFEINGFANAWKLEGTGFYRIELEYTSQRLFYYGLIISGVTVILCIVVIHVYSKRRKN